MIPKAMSTRVFDDPWLKGQRAEAQGQRVISWTTRWGVGGKATNRTPENTAHALHQPVLRRLEYGPM